MFGTMFGSVVFFHLLSNILKLASIQSSTNTGNHCETFLQTIDAKFTPKNGHVSPFTFSSDGFNISSSDAIVNLMEYFGSRKSVEVSFNPITPIIGILSFLRSNVINIFINSVAESAYKVIHKAMIVDTEEIEQYNTLVPYFLQYIKQRNGEINSLVWSDSKVASLIINIISTTTKYWEEILKQYQKAFDGVFKLKYKYSDLIKLVKRLNVFDKKNLILLRILKLAEDGFKCLG